MNSAHASGVKPVFRRRGRWCRGPGPRGHRPPPLRSCRRWHRCRTTFAGRACRCASSPRSGAAASERAAVVGDEGRAYRVRVLAGTRSSAGPGLRPGGDRDRVPAGLAVLDRRCGRLHAPDYFARRANGSAVMVDCRPAERRKPRDIEKFKAASTPIEGVKRAEVEKELGCVRRADPIGRHRSGAPPGLDLRSVAGHVAGHRRRPGHTSPGDPQPPRVPTRDLPGRGGLPEVRAWCSDQLYPHKGGLGRPEEPSQIGLYGEAA